MDTELKVNGLSALLLDVKKHQESLLSTGFHSDKNGGRCKFRTCDPHSVNTMAFRHILHLNQQLKQFKTPQSSMLVVYSYNYIQLLFKPYLELVEHQA